MRRGLTGLALVIALGAASCNGSSTSQPSATAPAGCGAKQRPAVALLLDARREPLPGAGGCLARTYTNIIGAPAWDQLPAEVATVSDTVFTWQRRVLQYGFAACDQCPQPGLDLDEVREINPQWILRDAAGNEVHPAGHPDWVLFDFTNVDFQAAWTQAVAEQLAGSRWTGIDVVDASNQPNWTSDPVDPATGQPMTDAARRTYLAQALSVVRAGMKTSGFSLVAENGPPAIVDSGQIASTDAVTVGEGFARLAGLSWDTLFAYFQEAVNAHVGAWVQDRGDLSRSQRIYGLASYLLVSGLRSSYAVPSGTDSPLYDVSLGDPLDVAARQGSVWLREFTAGYVAVNPGVDDGAVTLTDGTVVPVPAGGAVIQSAARRFASFR